MKDVKAVSWVKCVIILGIIMLLNGCFSSPAQSKTRNEPPPPRRFFESVEIDEQQTDPLSIGEYVSDGLQYRREAVFYSTALILADAGKLDGISKEQFEILAGMLFTDFPDYGHSKTIVIPNFANPRDPDKEKNAYIFISKKSDSGGNVSYSMETNIPISSITNWGGRGYNGYVMDLMRGLIRNEVPGSWVSIMEIGTRDDFLIYKGIAYPAKAAPLRFTGSGIGPNSGMKEILAGTETLSTEKNKLINALKEVLSIIKPENAEQEENAKFLEKYAYLSLAAYSYLEANIMEANQYYKLAAEVNTLIPDDNKGSGYLELYKILSYLLREDNEAV